jgi:hypothetical protein
MVKHIVLWRLKEELNLDEKAKVKKELKEALENLKHKISEIVEIKVNIEGMKGLNVDVLLETVFENENALKVYAEHPDHVAVGTEKIKPFMSERICYDYEF